MKRSLAERPHEEAYHARERCGVLDVARRPRRRLRRRGARRRSRRRLRRGPRSSRDIRHSNRATGDRVVAPGDGQVSRAAVWRAALRASIPHGPASVRTTPSSSQQASHRRPTRRAASRRPRSSAVVSGSVEAPSSRRRPKSEEMKFICTRLCPQRSVKKCSEALLLCANYWLVFTRWSGTVSLDRVIETLERVLAILNDVVRSVLAPRVCRALLVPYMPLADYMRRLSSCNRDANAAGNRRQGGSSHVSDSATYVAAAADETHDCRPLNHCVAAGHCSAQHDARRKTPRTRRAPLIDELRGQGLCGRHDESSLYIRTSHGNAGAACKSSATRAWPAPG